MGRIYKDEDYWFQAGGPIYEKLLKFFEADASGGRELLARELWLAYRAGTEDQMYWDKEGGYGD